LISVISKTSEGNFTLGTEASGLISRYSRQILFPGIGKDGQKRLENSSVVIIGCGALGTILATSMVRAGLGKVRIIDRDFIEYHNLQRQILFDEDDIEARLPKAVAAERHLKKVNSSIAIEGVVSDVNHANVATLVEGFDLILDGLDNLETRFLINDIALKKNIPWVYGAAVSSLGMVMPVIPHKTPCLQCYSPYPESGALMTCEVSGVISPAPMVVGAMQCTEAFKILVGAENISQGLLAIDVWEGAFTRVAVHNREDCRSCNGHYDFLDGKHSRPTTSLCGQNAVQVLSENARKTDFRQLASRLEKVGKVSFNEFMLNFSVDNQNMVVFADGRAIIKNTADEALARGLYAKYIGA
jgi:molybdopterin-synthase adenylyltransferase